MPARTGSASAPCLPSGGRRCWGNAALSETRSFCVGRAADLQSLEAKGLFGEPPRHSGRTLRRGGGAGSTPTGSQRDLAHAPRSALFDWRHFSLRKSFVLSFGCLGSDHDRALFQVYSSPNSSRELPLHMTFCVPQSRLERMVNTINSGYDSSQ